MGLMRGGGMRGRGRTVYIGGLWYGVLGTSINGRL